MSKTKIKGDLGEAMILADVVRRGYKVALPLGDDWPFDLVVYRNGKFERVQCKYTESDGKVIHARCMSASDWVQYKYTSKDIDWLVVYDKTTDACYYIPAELLGSGKRSLSLRLIPSINKQTKGTRLASDFRSF